MFSAIGESEMSEMPESGAREEIVSGTVRQLRTLIRTFGNDRGHYVWELDKFEPNAEFAIKTVWGTLDEFQRAEEPIGQIALQGLPRSRVLLTMRAGRKYREGRETFAVLREIKGRRPYSYSEDAPPPTNDQVERFNNFCDSLIVYLTQLGTISKEVRPKTGMKPHEIQQSILQVIAAIQQSPNQFVDDTQIAERLGLDVGDVQMHLELMEEEGYVNLAKTFGGHGALVTSQGRIMLQDPAYFHPEEPEIQDPRAVFVIHGRNLKARDAMFTFLRSIGLHPLEWSEAVLATGEGSPYIGQVLDTAFSRAQAVVVLMTPDDEVRLREPFREPGDRLHETQLTPQARPNVLFEAGMAMGRCPERTILVELGVLRPFSDIGGRHVIRLNNTTQRRQELAHRLETAGCAVNLRGTDWHTAGDFEIDFLGEQPGYILEDDFRSGLDAWTTSGLIQRIDFDYFPEDLPTERGWRRAEGAPPKLGLADYFGRKAIAIREVSWSDRPYALDLNVEPDSRRLGKIIEFVAKLEPGAAIYAHMDVQSKDLSKSERVWIQFQVGASKPKQVNDDEWVMFVTPTQFKEDWQVFRIDLRDAVAQTFGKEGKGFERLIGFRLRGNLDLAYISVCKF
jgi:predicted nucleotide-binding protein